MEVPSVSADCEFTEEEGCQATVEVPTADVTPSATVFEKADDKNINKMRLRRRERGSSQFLLQLH